MNPRQPKRSWILDEAECSDMEDSIDDSNSNNSLDDFIVDDADPIEVSSDSGTDVIDLCSTGPLPEPSNEDALAMAIEEVRTDNYADLYSLTSSEIIVLWNAHCAMLLHYTTQLAAMPLSLVAIVARNQDLIKKHVMRCRSLANFLDASRNPEWRAKINDLLYSELGGDLSRTGDFEVADDDDGDN